MKKSTLRTLLRWIHLLFTIPILGYIYQPAAEVEQYAGGVRFLFLPFLMLSGYAMYAGLLFALLTVAAWLLTFHFLGFGPALLSQILLLLARKILLTLRSRKKNPSPPTQTPVPSP